MPLPLGERSELVGVVGFEPTVSRFRTEHSGLTELYPVGPMPGFEPGKTVTRIHGAVHLHIGNWCGWPDSNRRFPDPKSGGLAAFLHPLKSGAAYGDQTRQCRRDKAVCSSVHQRCKTGRPRRIRTDISRFKRPLSCRWMSDLWCADKELNLDRPVIGRVL